MSIVLNAKHISITPEIDLDNGQGYNTAGILTGVKALGKDLELDAVFGLSLSHGLLAAHERVPTTIRNPEALPPFRDFQLYALHFPDGLENNTLVSVAAGLVTEEFPRINDIETSVTTIEKMAGMMALGCYCMSELGLNPPGSTVTIWEDESREIVVPFSVIWPRSLQGFVGERDQNGKLRNWGF